MEHFIGRLEQNASVRGDHVLSEAHFVFFERRDEHGRDQGVSLLDLALPRASHLEIAKSPIHAVVEQNQGDLREVHFFDQGHEQSNNSILQVNRRLMCLNTDQHFDAI